MVSITVIPLPWYRLGNHQICNSNIDEGQIYYAWGEASV